MNVHNLMEEIVKQRVDQLYENAKNEKVEWLSCDCENCRLDTVSFVLNRIPPKYVVSGRRLFLSRRPRNIPVLKKLSRSIC